MKSFILSQFGYCPLVWMFRNRILNNRIHRIHERALRIAYKDNQSSFKDLLEKDGSFTIHERNIQTLVIELFKVFNGFSPKIMDIVFPLNLNAKYPRENDFITHNVKKVGTEVITINNKKIDCTKFVLNASRHPKDRKPFPEYTIWYSKNKELIKFKFRSTKDNKIIEIIRRQ